MINIANFSDKSISFFVELEQFSKWQLCNIRHDKCSSHGVRKDFRGYDSIANNFSTKNRNKPEGSVSFDKLREFLPSTYYGDAPKYCPVFRFDDTVPVIGIDYDTVDFESPDISIVIPFKVDKYYIEISPSGTGLHVFCLLESLEYKKEVATKLYNNQSFIKFSNLSWCKDGEVRINDCLLTYSGIDVTKEYANRVSIIYKQDVLSECLNHVEFNSLYNTRVNGVDEDCSKIVYRLCGLIYALTGVSDVGVIEWIIENSPFHRSITKDTWKEQGKLHRLLTSTDLMSKITGTYYLSDINISNIQSTNLTNVDSTNLKIGTTKNVGSTAVSKDKDTKKEKINEVEIVDNFLSSELASKFVFCKEHWYLYNEVEHIYTSLTEKEVVTKVECYLQTLLYGKVTSVSKILAISQACVRKLQAFLSAASLSFNSWSNKSKNEYTWLHLRDAIYNVDLDVYEEESKSFFSTYKLKTTRADLEQVLSDYETRFNNSYYKEYLCSTFKDTSTIRMMQEFVGACVAEDAALQRILCLVGLAGSGKGTFVKFVGTVLGSFSGTNSLINLDSRFGTSSLLSHSVYVFPEMPKDMSKYTHAWDVINSLSGGDDILIEEKGKTAYSINLNVKLIISSNFPLKSANPSAFRRRALICHVTQSFDGTPNKKDYQTLMIENGNEINVGLAWVIAGYKLFKKYGVEESPASVSYKNNDTEDPIAGFVYSCVDIGDYRNDTDVVDYKSIRDVFQTYCNSQCVDLFKNKYLLRRAPTLVGEFLASRIFYCSTTEIIIESKHGNSLRGIRGLKVEDIGDM